VAAFRTALAIWLLFSECWMCTRLAIGTLLRLATAAVRRCSGLDLSGNQVSGSIPDSIGDLAALL
jgi:hypothetical protein